MQKHTFNNQTAQFSSEDKNSNGEENNNDKTLGHYFVDMHLIGLKGKPIKNIKSILQDVQGTITVTPKDPSSPLFSIKKFEDLNLKTELLKGIYNMGFNTPSKIQEMALPIMLMNPPQNLIAQSQSGTGKTAAFILAFLSRVNVNLNYPQILCLCPTYELAIQIGEVAVKMAKFCSGITFRYAVSGELLKRGEQLTEHIIIGTPGKLLDWGAKLKHFNMKKIIVFVLDEADIMIDVHGHQDQCIRIHNCLSKECQILFFSATYSTRVIQFSNDIVSHATLIKIRNTDQSLEWIKQYYIVCNSPEKKYKSIETIYGCISIGQMIIFCKSRAASNFLYQKLTEDGHAVAVLTGEQNVNERLEVIDNFRVGLTKVLIATNVLSRGIDVQQVTVVVNYDMPIGKRGYAMYDTYLHRIGRTGRFGHNGVAINLISESEIQGCNDIQNHFQREIKPLDIEDIEAVEELNDRNEDL